MRVSSAIIFLSLVLWSPIAAAPAPDDLPPMPDEIVSVAVGGSTGDTRFEIEMESYSFRFTTDLVSGVWQTYSHDTNIYGIYVAGFDELPNSMLFITGAKIHRMGK